jgi:hypothetical protein
MLMNYAIVVDGTVVNTVVWDGDFATWQPPEGSGAVVMPEGVPIGSGWSYDGTAFAPPPAPPVVPPTAAEILSTNTAQRNALLTQAGSAIAPLQDADDLGEATSGETALLKAWKQFRIAVNRIDLTLASPPWPPAPGPLTYAVTNPTA